MWAARRAAERLNADGADADDFAQDARVRVLEAYRHLGNPGDGYIRRVIQNGIRNAVRHLVRQLIWHAAELEEADECAADDCGGSASLEFEAVRSWLAWQDPMLQRIYQLIYIEGLTQRQVAFRLGVSQPRVSQLHRVLIRRGQVEPAVLAS
jgi:RNA polymerase sigma factor (sigma-70 family)